MTPMAQFDAGYNPQQDRILLRITNKSAEEYRLWLTRRVCRAFLTDFKTRTSSYRITQEMGAASSPASNPVHAVLRADLEQKATAATSDYSSSFKSGESFPLGEQGVIVETINLQPDASGKGIHKLSLHDGDGRGISIAVSVDLFNSIFEIVERVVNQAEWELTTTSNLSPPGSTLLQ